VRDYGTPAGDDTLLRTYWNSQATGLVNDEVFELKNRGHEELGPDPVRRMSRRAVFECSLRHCFETVLRRRHP
jgi:hypothetical protein